MREVYEPEFLSPRTKVSTTAVSENATHAHQTLASCIGPHSIEINGELRKTG
jgi:hypothetical protein